MHSSERQSRPPPNTYVPRKYTRWCTPAPRPIPPPRAHSDPGEQPSRLPMIWESDPRPPSTNVGQGQGPKRDNMIASNSLALPTMPLRDVIATTTDASSESGQCVGQGVPGGAVRLPRMNEARARERERAVKKNRLVTPGRKVLGREPQHLRGRTGGTRRHGRTRHAGGAPLSHDTSDNHTDTATKGCCHPPRPPSARRGCTTGETP